MERERVKEGGREGEKEREACKVQNKHTASASNSSALNLLLSFLPYNKYGSSATLANRLAI